MPQRRQKPFLHCFVGQSSHWNYVSSDSLKDRWGPSAPEKIDLYRKIVAIYPQCFDSLRLAFIWVYAKNKNDYKT